MIRLPRRWHRAGLPVALVSLVPLSLGSPWARASRAPALVFRGVTVIDVTNGEHRPDQTVLIVGNRIQNVGPARQVRIPSDAHVVDARGKYLIPGLWDMHTHEAVGFGFISNGVTGIREPAINVGGPLLRKQQKGVLAGTEVGPPRQLFAYGALGFSRQDVATVRAEVDSAKAWGFDMVKTSGTALKQFFALAAEARRIGIRFGGHIQDRVGLLALDAVDSGLSVIDHVGPPSGGLDSLCVHNARPRYRNATLATCRAAAERLRRHDAWWVVTLIETYREELEPNERTQRIRPTVLKRHTTCTHQDSLPGPSNWLRDSARFDLPPRPADTSGILSLIYRAGIPLLAGTDRVHFAIHAELAMMVSEGLPPLAALQAATLNPAKFLHATDSLGTVAPGKLADLVLLDADPLADITNTTLIRAVVANGRYFDRDTLDQMIRARCRLLVTPVRVRDSKLP